jgi:hypothetical protein
VVTNVKPLERATRCARGSDADRHQPKKDAARVRRTLELAQDMMTEQAKTLRWRLRARIGKRVRWYSEVEEQFGGRLEEASVAVRTKAGRAAG